MPYATIEELIPGFEAPTVIPFAHDGMVAVHSVVDSARLGRVLPELKEAGASGILVLPIDQLIAMTMKINTIILVDSSPAEKTGGAAALGGPRP